MEHGTTKARKVFAFAAAAAAAIAAIGATIALGRVFAGKNKTQLKSKTANGQMDRRQASQAPLINVLLLMMMYSGCILNVYRYHHMMRSYNHDDANAYDDMKSIDIMHIRSIYPISSSEH